MVFRENPAHHMGASVSIADIQTHEARSGEDRERVDDQMEKEALGSSSTDFPDMPGIPGSEHVASSAKIWKSRSCG